jgi:RNA polymerase sigma factor (TIGR02999 family)
MVARRGRSGVLICDRNGRIPELDTAARRSILNELPDSMSGFPKNDVTLLLEAVAQGEEFAAEKLMPLVYDELRALAAARMASESAGHTLQPTALVHEAWLRLSGSGERSWNDRAHFFRVAALAMRRILVDHARQKARLKRGENPVRAEDIELLDLTTLPPDERVLLVDQALERLERIDPEAAQVVTLKVFANYTTREIAGILDVGERTIERRWTYARARLMQMLQEAK